jgi:hypothetical protein
VTKKQSPATVFSGFHSLARRRITAFGDDTNRCEASDPFNKNAPFLLKNTLFR